jgi:hypothetical protein
VTALYIIAIVLVLVLQHVVIKIALKETWNLAIRRAASICDSDDEWPSAKAVKIRGLIR